MLDSVDLDREREQLEPDVRWCLRLPFCATRRPSTASTGRTDRIVSCEASLALPPSRASTGPVDRKAVETRLDSAVMADLGRGSGSEKLSK